MCIFEFIPGFDTLQTKTKNRCCQYKLHRLCNTVTYLSECKYFSQRSFPHKAITFQQLSFIYNIWPSSPQNSTKYHCTVLIFNLNWYPRYMLLLLLLLLSRFSHVRLCATPQTAAHQAPPSLGFSRHRYMKYYLFTEHFLEN